MQLQIMLLNVNVMVLLLLKMLNLLPCWLFFILQTVNMKFINIIIMVMKIPPAPALKIQLIEN